MTDQPVEAVPAEKAVLAEKAVSAGKTAPAETAAPAGKGKPPGSIPFRLRIGVIGHIKLTDSEELREAVRHAIERAVKESGYRAAKPRATGLTLTVVSALAEGADRIVAEEVLNCPHSKLLSVLPVYEKDIDVYRGDFKNDKSRAKFDHYYDRAWRHISPPQGAIPHVHTQEARKEGYLWAALAVVRNCDVLIALWDEEEGSRGTGGTADVIGRLQNRDRRISDAEPTETGLSVFGAAASRILPVMDEPLVLETTGPLRIIVPTKGDHKLWVDDDPPFRAAADLVKRRLASDLDDLDRFNRMGFSTAKWARFNRKWFSPAKKWARAEKDTAKYLGSGESRQYRRLSGIFEQITPPLVRADQLAKVANRHFLALSYLLFLCTAAATFIAALEAVVLPGIWELTIVEIILLIASLVIVFAEKLWKTHERWTAYRFLAERLRSACYLLAVGVKPEIEFDMGGTPGESGQHGWIRRAFAEVLAELSAYERREAHEWQEANGHKGRDEQKDAEPLHVVSSLIRAHWVSGQIDYFKKKSANLKFQHKIVFNLMAVVLFVTIVAGILHAARIWPLNSTPTEALVMCAIGLPAFAGFLVNVRSLREFSRHSNRYANMAKVLHWYLDRFEEVEEAGARHLEESSSARHLEESSVRHLRHLAVNVDHVLTAESRSWLGAVSERGIEIHG
jgi:hypothetical protein